MPQYVMNAPGYLGALIGTDRTILSPGCTLSFSGTRLPGASLAPSRYVNSKMPASHVAVPEFLMFQPALNFCSVLKTEPSLGDFQINVQLSSLGTVAVGVGEADGTAGTGVAIGSGVAVKSAAGVFVGADVAGGLRVDVSVGSGICVEVEVGKRLVGALLDMGSAAQASVSASPAQRNAFLFITNKQLFASRSPGSRPKAYVLLNGIWAACHASLCQHINERI